MSQADIPSVSRPRLPPGREWKRMRALRHNVPLRFLDKWSGCGAGGGRRVTVECDLFHGLPTKGMRAWIEQGEATA